MLISERMEDSNFIVTPWEVKGKIDYDKLVKQFGVKLIDNSILKRLEKHTGDLHYFLERKIFFAHMYFDSILDDVEKKKKFYLYTGRAPSGPVHLGHLIPWMFCKWLQDKLGVPLLFQIPDEEKFFFKEDITLENTKKWAYENILDIIALGFDPKKTKIFLDTEYAGHMYKYACMVAKKTTLSTVKALFGLKDSNNIGEIFYTSMQSVPAFLPSIIEGKNTQCLIPCAIDQDVHFRLTRDIAPKIGYPKPATILCRFLPSLTEGGKMSSSIETNTIFTHDTSEQVKNKIMKFAFSGGRGSVKEHREKGGVPEVDVSYQYLTYFLEDSKKLKEIYDEYKSGKMLTGELKEITIDIINNFLKKHQKEKEKAKGLVDKFILKNGSI
jgi:tryptophanyl-tRNA synthetase